MERHADMDDFAVDSISGVRAGAWVAAVGAVVDNERSALVSQRLMLLDAFSIAYWMPRIGTLPSCSEIAGILRESYDNISAHLRFKLKHTTIPTHKLVRSTLRTSAVVHQTTFNQSDVKTHSLST